LLVQLDTDAVGPLFFDDTAHEIGRLARNVGGADEDELPPVDLEDTDLFGIVSF